MAALLTVKVKNPDKSGAYLIINQSDFDGEKHELFDENEQPQFAAADSAGPAKIGPATLVGDNEVVLPRVPHPEGLIPPAEDFKPVPPKAKVGEVIGYDAGHEVRAAGEAADMVGALDATFGAVRKEEAFKVSIPEQEPTVASVGSGPVGTLADREKAAEEAAKQKESQEGEIDPEAASRAEMFEYLRSQDIDVGNSTSTENLRQKVKDVQAGEAE